ncbi:hypothetical protein ON010_g3103 [Phytophthora cinnamomi]|nr:hypothetical protein ON010_g3103 [Phytophthora cinnamomi]
MWQNDKKLHFLHVALDAHEVLAQTLGRSGRNLVGLFALQTRENRLEVVDGANHEYDASRDDSDEEVVAGCPAVDDGGETHKTQEQANHSTWNTEWVTIWSLTIRLVDAEHDERHQLERIRDESPEQREVDENAPQRAASPSIPARMQRICIESRQLQHPCSANFAAALAAVRPVSTGKSVLWYDDHVLLDAHRQVRSSFITAARVELADDGTLSPRVIDPTGP